RMSSAIMTRSGSSVTIPSGYSRGDSGRCPESTSTSVSRFSPVFADTGTTSAKSASSATFTRCRTSASLLTRSILVTTATTIARTTCRVVCGRLEVIAIFWPMIAFVSVDFPAFGRPTKQANPAWKPLEAASIPFSDKTGHLFADHRVDHHVRGDLARGPEAVLVALGAEDHGRLERVGSGGEGLRHGRLERRQAQRRQVHGRGSVRAADAVADGGAGGLLHPPGRSSGERDELRVLGVEGVDGQVRH